MLRGYLEAAARDLLTPENLSIDFTQPAGEAALVGPDSVSWRVFKNPVALFVGGVAAVILELAEPRVRAGVWGHSTFRTAPVDRLRRTGLAAMVTVYGARSVAEAMIAGINRLHDRVQGTTPDGLAYHASDPELLDWVQATAAFGFLEAYGAYVAPVSEVDRDRYYGEGYEAARIYGAIGAPSSQAEIATLFATVHPRLEQSPILFEFLEIMNAARVLPGRLRLAQGVFIRAAVEIVPDWARAIVGLGGEYRLKTWERAFVRTAGAAADRIVLRNSPAVLACRRLGLSDDFLYRRQG